MFYTIIKNMERKICMYVIATVVALVTAVGPPRYIGDNKYRHVARVNHTKKLLCPVEAEPLPMVQWLKDEQDINEMWDRHRVMKDGSLRIKDVVMEDAGRYVCRAINGFGSININYTLIVVDEENGMVKQDNNLYPQTPEEDLFKEGAAPKFMQPEKMKRQLIKRPVDSSVRLKCRASGNPRPSITWMKDHVIIHGADPHKPTWTLRLQELKEADSGHYTCLVSNRLGTINYTYTLEVIEKMNSKPVLIAPHPLNTTVNYGQTTSLKCRIDSDMTPHIQWLKRVENPSLVKNLNNTIDVAGQKFIVLKTGEVWNGPDGTYLNKLMIHHATEADAGMYICLGANTIGYSFRSAFLTVISESRSEYTKDAGSVSLPIIIGVPACVVIFIVTIAIIVLQRRKRNKYPGNVVKSPHFNRVPTHEPDTCVSPQGHNPQTNIHVNPMHGVQYKDLYTGLQSPQHSQTSNRDPFSSREPLSSRDAISNRDALSKNSHSIDFYTDISSVSQSHHNHHHMQQYQYN